MSPDSLFERILRYMLVIFVCTLFPGRVPVRAQEQADIENVPVAEQIPVLLYALKYHKMEQTRTGDTFLVLIVYPPDFASEKLAEVKTAFEALAGKKVKGRAIQFKPVMYQSKQQLRQDIARKKASAVYITQSNKSNIRAILSVTKSAKVMSIAGSYGYVHWHGASLGVERVGGKNKILVSLMGCKNEGVEFDARLLRMASVFF